MSEAEPCTGVAAGWCPRCGDCSCPRDEEGWLSGSMNHPDCPLHAPSSDHARDPERLQREEAMRRLRAWAEGVPTADLLAVIDELMRAERERGEP